MPTNILKIGELFCGPGGIAIGAELANETIRNPDINHYAGARLVDLLKGGNKVAEAFEKYWLNKAWQ